MSIRATRKMSEGQPLPTKINMPKREDEVLLPTGQKKPELHRYRLQVDRQTKSSFETLKEAEAAGKVIKKAHPKLQVSIYDAEKSVQNVIID